MIPLMQESKSNIFSSQKFMQDRSLSALSSNQIYCKKHKILTTAKINKGQNSISQKASIKDKNKQKVFVKIKNGLDQKNKNQIEMQSIPVVPLINIGQRINSKNQQSNASQLSIKKRQLAMIKQKFNKSLQTQDSLKQKLKQIREQNNQFFYYHYIQSLAFQNQQN